MFVHKDLFKELIKCLYAPLFVFSVNVIGGSVFDMYGHFPNIDILMHFAGGFSMGITGALLLELMQKQQWGSVNNKLVALFIIVAYVSLTATVWEFAEFTSDQLLGTRMQSSLADTMFDTFLGVVGGVIAGAGMLWRKK